MGIYVNGWFDNVFGWLSVVLMSVGAIALLWQSPITSFLNTSMIQSQYE